MLIGAISDTHGYLPEITKPCDIFCIAGDISPVYIQGSYKLMKSWLENNFASWVKTIPAKKIYLIAGNHDFYFHRISVNDLRDFYHACTSKFSTFEHREDLQNFFKISSNFVYLKNEYATFSLDNREVTIFGTPYCNLFGSWPFMRDNITLEETFKSIPDKVDIIISHSPAYGFGTSDCILEFPHNPDIPEHVGNKPLANRLKEVDYKLLLCGHIHSGNHEFDPTFKCANVSYVDESYSPTYEPFYIEI